MSSWWGQPQSQSKLKYSILAPVPPSVILKVLLFPLYKLQDGQTYAMSRLSIFLSDIVHAVPVVWSLDPLNHLYMFVCSCSGCLPHTLRFHSYHSLIINRCLQTFHNGSTMTPKHRINCHSVFFFIGNTSDYLTVQLSMHIVLQIRLKSLFWLLIKC